MPCTVSPLPSWLLSTKLHHRMPGIYTRMKTMPLASLQHCTQPEGLKFLRACPSRARTTLGHPAAGATQSARTTEAPNSPAAHRENTARKRMGRVLFRHACVLKTRAHLTKPLPLMLVTNTTKLFTIQSFDQRTKSTSNYDSNV